jgi:hypothetical protein
MEHFKRWANNPAVREAICGKCLSPQEKEVQLREIFGVSTWPAASVVSQEDAAPNG